MLPRWKNPSGKTALYFFYCHYYYNCPNTKRQLLLCPVFRTSGKWPSAAFWHLGQEEIHWLVLSPVQSHRGPRQMSPLLVFIFQDHDVADRGRASTGDDNCPVAKILRKEPFLFSQVRPLTVGLDSGAVGPHRPQAMPGGSVTKKVYAPSVN